MQDEIDLIKVCIKNLDKNLFTICGERDLTPNSAQYPHVLQYIGVFPRYLEPIDTRSLQIVNKF